MCFGGASAPSTPPPEPPQAPPEGDGADALAPLLLGSTRVEHSRLANNHFGKNALTIALGSLPRSTGLTIGGR